MQGPLAFECNCAFEPRIPVDLEEWVVSYRTQSPKLLVKSKAKQCGQRAAAAAAKAKACMIRDGVNRRR